MDLKMMPRMPSGHSSMAIVPTSGTLALRPNTKAKRDCTSPTMVERPVVMTLIQSPRYMPVARSKSPKRELTRSLSTANVQGETSYWSGVSDYAHAYLIPGDETPQADSQSPWLMIPESYVSLTDALSQSRGGRPKTGFQNLDPGTYKLVFLWRNDDWGGSNVAAMIDNVKIEKLSNEPNVSFATSLEFPLTEVGGSATATLTVHEHGRRGSEYFGDHLFESGFRVADAVEFPDVIASVAEKRAIKSSSLPPQKENDHTEQCP